MKHLTASTSPSPFSGENWFDPLEDAIRFRVRAFIEAVVAEEAQAALGGRARYQRSGAPKGYRNGHRHRQLVGTFGALTVSLPRVRLLDGDGGEKEWRSQTIQAYKRLTKRAEAMIANTYLAGTNTRRVRRALAGLFGGKVGKDAVSRAWRKVKTDWESWQARDLSGEDIVRLILDGTGVKARLDGRVLSIPLLVVLGVRRDGQKVLLAVKNMGGETEAAWRHVLEDLLGRGLKAPELLIVDGGKGLEAALASLWSDIPVQRCTVHKERNLLAHAPKALHDEVKADYTDMMYAENAEQVRKKRKAFLAKWRLRCRGVADSLEEAGERLFTFLRYPPQQWKSLRTTNAIDIPVQRCTVHKERNLLAHAPKALHDEVKADYTDMMYAENAEQVRKKRKAFLAKWRLRCRGVADSLEEAGERLFTFLRYPPQQWKSLRTTNAIERLHGEFKRRVKTQCALPNAETAAMLFWALMASGQITMRRVGGWQTLADPAVTAPADEIFAARRPPFTVSEPLETTPTKEAVSARIAPAASTVASRPAMTESSAKALPPISAAPLKSAARAITAPAASSPKVTQTTVTRKIRPWRGDPTRWIPRRMS